MDWEGPGYLGGMALSAALILEGVAEMRVAEDVSLEVSVVRGQGESAPAELLPRVHRVAALLKRWLLGTYQGAVRPDHLDYYLAEFTFRLHRSLLQWPPSSTRASGRRSRAKACAANGSIIEIISLGQVSSQSVFLHHTLSVEIGTIQGKGVAHDA
jgi:hypothetical protein